MKKCADHKDYVEKITLISSYSLSVSRSANELYSRSAYIYIVAKRVECSPMVRETGVQSQVESYQRLKKWYLTFSIIKVKWSNLGNGGAPSPTLQCCCYWKGSLRVALNYGRPLYLLFYIWNPWKFGKISRTMLFLFSERNLVGELIKAAIGSQLEEGPRPPEIADQGFRPGTSLPPIIETRNIENGQKENKRTTQHKVDRYLNLFHCKLCLIISFNCFFLFNCSLKMYNMISTIN